MPDYNPQLILPVGTRVVTLEPLGTGSDELPRGTVGIIQQAPTDATHAYRVCFMDNSELALKRQQFSIYSHFKNPDQPDTLDEALLRDHVIYRCVVGSQAYGLAHDDSDVDVRGMYLPPADLHWSLHGVPEQVESNEKDEVFWEVQKFLRLALKANPNILECLYTPLVQYSTPLVDDLLAQRDIFMCKLIYQTYNGYVMSQFRRMKKHRAKHGSIKWKHAMHLIRLLLAGITALKDGYIVVEVQPQHRDDLLAIRHGAMTWEQVNTWRKQLHDGFDTAYETTTLPERPDYDAANQFLIRARREAL